MQLDALIPLFIQLSKVNEGGNIGAIAAQIYPDGILCTVLDGNGAIALCEAIGKNPDKYNAVTLKERLNNAL